MHAPNFNIQSSFKYTGLPIGTLTPFIVGERSAPVIDIRFPLFIFNSGPINVISNTASFSSFPTIIFDNLIA